MTRVSERELMRLVEAVTPALALLPIIVHNTPDYAEAVGEQFQAMTMRPDAFLALNSRIATIRRMYVDQARVVVAIGERISAGTKEHRVNPIVNRPGDDYEK